GRLTRCGPGCGGGPWPAAHPIDDMTATRTTAIKAAALARAERAVYGPVIGYQGYCRGLSPPTSRPNRRTHSSQMRGSAAGGGALAPEQEPRRCRMAAGHQVLGVPKVAASE